MKEALDSGSVEGIALDSYQYYHYKLAFDSDYYIKLKSSIGVSVGAVISGPGIPLNMSTMISSEDHLFVKQHLDESDSKPNPLIPCLKKHAIYGVASRDRLLGKSLNHPKELQKQGIVIDRTKTIFESHIREHAIVMLASFVLIFVFVGISTFIAARCRCLRANKQRNVQIE